MLKLTLIVSLLIVFIFVYIGYRIKKYYFREMDEIIPGMYLGNLRDA